MINMDLINLSTIIQVLLLLLFIIIIIKAQALIIMQGSWDPPDAKHRGRVRFFYYCYSKVVLIKNIFEKKYQYNKK